MTTNTNNSNTALQVTNFDFYGDSLIALQDNATGEIYTSITHVLRGIGFTEKQIEHQKKKIFKWWNCKQRHPKIFGCGFTYAKCKWNNMHIES